MATASERAKTLGAKSLTEVANHYGWTTEALRKWHDSNQKRFDSVVLGYLTYHQAINFNEINKIQRVL